MGDMFDHDRLNELQAKTLGISMALDELLEIVAELPDPTADQRARLAQARLHLQAADLLARDARVVGEARWADAPDEIKHPDRH